MHVLRESTDFVSIRVSVGDSKINKPKDTWIFFFSIHFNPERQDSLAIALEE